MRHANGDPLVISIWIPFPPSANSYFRGGNGQRGYFIPKEVKAFRSEVAKIALAERIKPLVGRLSLEIQLFGPNRRKFDIDNRVKAVADALQHAGCFADDEAIDKLSVERGEIIKGGACKVLILARTGV